MHDDTLSRIREIFPNAAYHDPASPDDRSRTTAQPSPTAPHAEQLSSSEMPASEARTSLDIWTHKRPHTGPYLELHVHEFQPGYAEATALMRPERYRPKSPGKKREKKNTQVSRSEMSDDDRARSARRARKMVRHRIKQLAGDRILTLTSRKYMYDQSRCFVALKEFNRLMTLRFPRWAYVAVPELHPKHADHWHMHLAINAYYQVDAVRLLWRQALRNCFKECKLDHTPGNIDIRKREGSRHSLNALARYLSKYITKQTEDGWMHSRRYSFGGKMREIRKTTLYCDYVNDLTIIRKVQELTGATLARNPRWDIFGGFDCMMIETEPTTA